MGIRQLRLFVLLSIAAGSLVACGGASSSGEEADENELRSTEQGFEYDCRAPEGRRLMKKASAKVLVTSGHLRYEGDYGLNLGTREKTYKAPKGTSRARFKGFDTGEDCILKAVADDALLKGQPRGNVRLQCAGDDFQQDILSCSGPKAATLTPSKVAPTPPVPAKPPANAKAWSCTTTTSTPALEEAALKMQVVDGAIRLVLPRLELTGTRDREFHPRSGNAIAYDDIDYGGDCSLSLVVDGNALVAATKQTTLKVRCAGENVTEDRYACKAQ